MFAVRLMAARAEGYRGPSAGPWLLAGADASDVEAFDDRHAVHCVHPVAPVHARLRAVGVSASPTFDAVQGPFSGGLVVLPRSRARARHWIAEVASRLAPGAPLMVDGARGDGIDAVRRALRGRLDDPGGIAKAHGRLLWGLLPRQNAFADWAAPMPAPATVGFVTAPGAFSSDGIDPGSRVLADAVPAGLAGRIADLGAGWGYLSARLLASPRPARVDLVEADHDSLAAARVNLRDDRAAFHWADATTWRPDAPVDAVIMNPPFHDGRRPDPDLGRAFIAAAAAMLAPRGALWMVANRHLPYESDLDRAFADWHEIGGDPAFKVIAARMPRGPRKGHAR